MLVVKLGINYCYEKEYFSIDHWRYNYSISSMENIDSTEFNALVTKSENEVNLIYMGRESCPVCVELLPNIKTIFEKFDILELPSGKIKINQYYFDSEQNRTELAQQTRELIEANTVPAIIIIKNGEISLFESDSLMLNDYIEKFEKELLNL